MSPDDEDLEKFSELHGQSWKTLNLEDMASGSKGKSCGKGKGKNKGKGGNKSSQLALEDKKEEKPKEEELKDALKKARKARDTVGSAVNDLEEALEKASSKLSRQGKAGAEGWKLQLNKVQAGLKSTLSGKKGVGSKEVKMLLEEAAKVVKGPREETKELKALANRAGSVASSKKSRGAKK